MPDKLTIVPITHKEAKVFIERHHRHLPPSVGAIFVVAVANADQEIVGVAMCGRPIVPQLCDGWTIEINRCATDGTKNACSALYAACWRIARNMGYRRAITYTHKSESGVSLRAAGWKIIGEVTRGNKWHNRPTVDTGNPFQEKLKWEKTA